MLFSLWSSASRLMVGRVEEGCQERLKASARSRTEGGRVRLRGLVGVGAFDLDPDDVDAVVFLVTDGGGVMTQQAE